MKKIFAYLNRIPVFLWLLLIIGLFLYFIANRDGPRTWKEEVRLSDGTVILTERSANWERPGSLARQSIKVIDAKGLDTPPEWSDKWNLMILDRDKQGVWNLIVRVGSCYDWNDTALYRQYKAIDGEWQQVELDKSLHGRPANLEGNIYTLLKTMPKFIAVDEKQYAPNHPLPDNVDVHSPFISSYWQWVNIYAHSGCDLYCWLYGENKSGVECEKYGFCEQPGNESKPQCYRYRETPNSF
ncbi:hypothetical protein [Eikenella corrodens]|jgi:hypothetical protein|uniref:hypothetical protein n=1 Tax=Eikenella corrodens TaxID=539 RepID=UPI00129B3339|nr:hypothetical protein [Eikenella corrodens]